MSGQGMALDSVSAGSNSKAASEPRQEGTRLEGGGVQGWEADRQQNCKGPDVARSHGLL